MVRKKVTSELDKAEIKLQSLRDKRDQINEEAAGARQERDMLNDKRGALVEEMRAAKRQRDAVVRDMRQHRDRRNEMHRHAHELIELKRKARGGLKKGIGSDIGRLRKEVEDMDRKQQTTVLTLAEENELIDQLRAAIKEVRQLEAAKGAQDQIFKEVKEIDAAIDTLLEDAEKEHHEVIALAGKANELHDRVTQHVRDISVLIAEANKKHQAFVALRERADAEHAKVMEMQGKVLSERKASRAEEVETRKILRAQSKAVRSALLDKKKLDEAADHALEELLRKGKVEIRG